MLRLPRRGQQRVAFLVFANPIGRRRALARNDAVVESWQLSLFYVTARGFAEARVDAEDEEVRLGPEVQLVAGLLGAPGEDGVSGD